MDWKTFTVEIVGKAIWPTLVLFIIIYFKESLIKLCEVISKIKYKDLEIWFRKEIQQIKMDAISENISDVSEETKILLEENVKKQPAQSIIKAWTDLEESIYKKIKALLPPQSIQYQRLTPDRAVTELSLLGALPPKKENIINSLKIMRNRLVHSDSGITISHKNALEYVSLAKKMQNVIELINELPAVKLTALTLLILEINHLIDSGKYDNISIDVIYKHLEDGTIFEYLKQTAGQDIDLSLLINDSPYPGFKKFYIDNMQSMYNAYGGDERRKWGVEHKGLCLLLAWTNEIIQQGSGWHPSN